MAHSVLGGVDLKAVMLRVSAVSNWEQLEVCFTVDFGTKWATGGHQYCWRYPSTPPHTNTKSRLFSIWDMHRVIGTFLQRNNECLIRNLALPSRFRLTDNVSDLRLPNKKKTAAPICSYILCYCYVMYIITPTIIVRKNIYVFPANWFAF